MAELDKVIKQLEVLIEDSEYSEIIDLTPDDAKSILELLKKQVPMEPKEMKVAKCHYQCAICGSYVGTKGLTVNRFNKKYCAECGQAVKWSEET